ncbi:MAG: hypothetical protein FWC39_14025 [Bacteroidetes bacterium]|nr:hypothetical protein [Bacteroidota bacterium]
MKKNTVNLKKTITLLSIVLASLITFNSCGGKDKDPQPTDKCAPVKAENKERLDKLMKIPMFKNNYDRVIELGWSEEQAIEYALAQISNTEYKEWLEANKACLVPVKTK